MKIYLAGERTAYLSTGEESVASKEIDFGRKFHDRVRRRLFSYFYHGRRTGELTVDIKKSIENKMDIFLDSGAYTAHTKKEPIPIKQYAGFIRKFEHHFNLIANLDVIGGDGGGSWENLKRLEDLGASTFPVFHFGDDIKYLDLILQGDYPFFALGGLVGGSRKQLQAWLDHIWQTYLIDDEGHAIRQVHGFGLTDQVLMFRYPWFSVDSSSWVMTGVFGSCTFMRNDGLKKILFSTDGQQAKNVNGWSYFLLPDAMREEIDKWIEPFDLTPEQLRTNYLARDLINAYTFQEMETLGVDRFTVTQGGLLE